MQYLNDALELRRVRLEEDWTYQELAIRIGGLNAATVQRFIEQPARRVRETTLFKIRRFLDGRQPTPRRRRGPLERRMSS